MSYNPPSIPCYFDATNSDFGPLLQSAIVVQELDTYPRDFVLERFPWWVPGRSLACVGDRPKVVAGSFTPDSGGGTPSLFFGANSPVMVYPFGGQGALHTRSTAGTTYWFWFKLLEIPASGTAGPLAIRIMGQCASYIAQYGTNGSEVDGPAVLIPDHAVGTPARCYLGWVSASSPSAPLYCTDSTGAISVTSNGVKSIAASSLKCEIVPGTWYCGFVSIGGQTDYNQSDYGYLRFGLYNADSGTWSSPRGNQYFSYGATDNVGLNKIPNYIPQTTPLRLNPVHSDLVIHPEPGLVYLLKAAGILNGFANTAGTSFDSYGSTTLEASLTSNPWAWLVSTKPTSGSSGTNAPLALSNSTVQSDSGYTISYGGDCVLAPAASTVGKPAGLKYVAYGDCTAWSDSVHIYAQVNPPLGTSETFVYKLYYNDVSVGSPPDVTADSPKATNSTGRFVITPTNRDVIAMRITATGSSSGNVYVYGYQWACLQAGAVDILLCGNSISTGTGSSLLSTGAPLLPGGNGTSFAVALGQSLAAAGYAVNIATCGIDGTNESQFATSGAPNATWITTASGAATAYNQGLYLSHYCDLIRSIYGRSTRVVLELPGNHPSESSSQVQATLTNILTNSNVLHVYLPASPNQIWSKGPGDQTLLYSTANTTLATAAAAKAPNASVVNLNSQLATANWPAATLGGHPNPWTAGVRGADFAAALLAELSGTSPASSYAILGIPSAPNVNEVYTVVAVLTGHATTSGTITPTPASGITWGSAMSISSGGVYGATTVQFTSPGTYTPAFTHTGLGFSGEPNLSSVTAVNGGGGLTDSSIQADVVAALVALGYTDVRAAKLDRLDTTVSSRSTFAGGVVAGVASAVTVGTNSDKAGYSLAPSGLNTIAGFNGWSFPQMVRAVAALLLGKRTGTPSVGSAGTVAFTDPANNAAYGTLTVDASGNITADAMTPPA